MSARTGGQRDHHYGGRTPPAQTRRLGLEDYLAASLARQQDLDELIRKLWARIEEQQILLNSALHELFTATKPEGYSRERFIGSWYSQKRKRLE